LPSRATAGIPTSSPQSSAISRVNPDSVPCDGEPGRHHGEAQGRNVPDRRQALNCARERLVRLTGESGVTPRQSYTGVGKLALIKYPPVQGRQKELPQAQDASGPHDPRRQPQSALWRQVMQLLPLLRSFRQQTASYLATLSPNAAVIFGVEPSTAMHRKSSTSICVHARKK
jgi:hypothetical protein